MRAVQPYTIIRKFKTSVGFNLDPAVAGALSGNKIKLNSAYDPTGDLGSGQPLGYDQYTALYQRAAVIGWMVKIQLVSIDNTYPIVVGFTPMVSSTLLTAYDHYRELPGTVSTVVTPDVDKNFLSCKGRVKHFFLPRSARLLGDDTVTHGVGSDPSRILYGHIWAQALDKANDTNVVRIVMDVHQVVVFYVPEIPSRS